MTFDIADIISVEGAGYRVIGKIRYRNPADNCCWDEYRLKSLDSGGEYWLSIDDTYREYSIWQMTRSINPSGYHESDKGMEIVMSASGNVDVDPGERASFVEFEDASEENILSREIWSDETEFSAGHYISVSDIQLIGHDDKQPLGFSFDSEAGAGIRKVLVLFSAIGVLFILYNIYSMLSDDTSIGDYLKDAGNYAYVTSITGSDKNKADVYKSTTGMTIDGVVRDLIEQIEGNTQYVQQDSEEEKGSVAILTEDEYCIIYISEDGPVMIQLSNREYAYTSDQDVYHASRRTRTYYRSFYYTTGYKTDQINYSSSSSPYSSYDGDRIVYSGNDVYNSYSSSVRQSSISSRSSSGGGLSGGK